MNIYIVTETIYNGDEDEVYQSNLRMNSERLRLQSWEFQKHSKIEKMQINILTR